MYDRASGEPRRRFTHLAPAWEAAREAAGPGWQPPSSVVLDGELLVYDESATEAGRYDEARLGPCVPMHPMHVHVHAHPHGPCMHMHM